MVSESCPSSSTSPTGRQASFPLQPSIQVSRVVSCTVYAPHLIYPTLLFSSLHWRGGQARLGLALDQTWARPVKRDLWSRCFHQYPKAARAVMNQRRALVRSTQTAFFMRLISPSPSAFSSMYICSTRVSQSIEWGCHRLDLPCQTRQRGRSRGRIE